MKPWLSSWVEHVRKGLAFVYQFLRQLYGILKQNIVIDHSMNNQQMILADYCEKWIGELRR